MLPYYPALRGKPAEFAACGRIGRQYQSYVRPRFVVPPPNESDPEKGCVPRLDEIAHMMGDRVGRSWPILPAFLDPQFATSALGDDGVETLFRIVWGFNKRLVPVFTLNDLHNTARRKLLIENQIKAGIYIDFEEADPSTVVDGVASLGCRPEQCVLFLDFTGAPLGPNFAPSIAEIFDQLDGVARWAKIVYQASAYPEKLPVGPGECDLIARTEWTTFFAAIDETGVQQDRLGYGDFGADCGRMAFSTRKGGGRPRPHLRYTGKTHTLVVRGSDSGDFNRTMRDVCKQVIGSKDYAGRSFSYEDDRIWCNAKELTYTCGNPTVWRELNTAHHLVRVVRDLGAMSGVTFKEDEAREFAEQNVLFREP